jgi:outer membrane cobalamin receptor
MRSRRVTVTGLALLLIPLAVASCRPRQNTPLPDRSKGTLITAADVERTGATTVWEALQRTVRYTHFQESGRGNPERVRRRGTSSINLLEDTPIMMDNVRVMDIRLLDQIPSREIDFIQVLSGIDATTYYGTNSGDGIILIFTRID